MERKYILLIDHSIIGHLQFDKYEIVQVIFNNLPKVFGMLKLTFRLLEKIPVLNKIHLKFFASLLIFAETKPIVITKKILYS